MVTTYTYETKKGINKEVFDSKGYVTLTRNGKHIYEHQFSTLGVEAQRLQLEVQLLKYGIKAEKVETV